MLSKLKNLLEENIRVFYYIISLNIISLFFELLCLVSIPLFVGSIFSPDILIKKYNYYQLYNITELNLNKDNLIFFSIFFLVSAFLLKNIFLIFIYYFQGKFLRDVKLDLEKKIFNFYLKSPIILHIKNNPANIIRNINDEVMGFYNYIYHLFLLVREIFTLILLFIIFAFTNFYAAFTVLIFLLIIVSLYLKLIKPIIKIRSVNNQIFRKNMSQSIMETFKAIQDIKIYSKEKFVENNFLQNAKRFEQNHFIFGLIGKLPRVILEIISVLVGLIFIIFILNSNTEFDSQTISILALFAIGIIRFIPAFNAVTVSINYLKIFNASIQLLVKELSNYKKIRKEENYNINKDFKANSKDKSYIYFDKVTFDYGKDNPFKLQPTTLKFKKGKKIAILGKTGSGKSTLNYLLAGFLDPLSGNIYYQGKNIKRILKWQEKIGYVSQNIFLFNTSIKNNITMFSNEKKIDKKKLEKALKISDFKDKIESLKDGIESIVGVDGLNFSGGERQRIAIARAIYKDPEILLLDEFTSAIDGKTRSNILENLFKYFKYKSIILVTHDPIVSKKCDNKYHLVNGVLRKNKFA